MTWQQKALRRLIRSTCNADQRHPETNSATAINACINNVHWVSATYDAQLGLVQLPRASRWPGVYLRRMAQP